MPSIHILTKPVITLYECKEWGYCNKLYINPKTMKCEYIAVIHNLCNYVIKSRDILTATSDAIIVKNTSYIQLQTNLDLQLSDKFCLSNNKTYTISGDFLGVTKNIVLNDKYHIKTIILDNNTEIDGKNIFNISDQLIIIKDDITTNTKHKYKPKKVPKTKVEYENINVKVTNTPSTKQISLPSTPHSKSTPKTHNPNILIGRKVTKTISCLNGEIIAKQGYKITREIIRLATISGKLYELVKFSE